MPYSVENLLREQHKLITISENEEVTKALDQMVEYDFSQLPVVDNNSHLVGMVTYESIMQGARSFNIRADELLIRDVILTNIKTFDIGDNLFDLLNEIKKNNAVVIVDPEAKPIGIVTSYDTSEYLRSHSEGMMRVENIERNMRFFILASYSNQDGELDKTRLEQAIQSLYQPKQDQPGLPRQKSFNDLTMNDCILLLTSKENWNILEPILKCKRDWGIELLNKVRNTRNDLAHFREEISTRALKDLVFCDEWLGRRLEEYENVKERTRINAIFEEHQTKLNDPKIDFSQKPNERKSVYVALAEKLASQKEKVILLTFEEVEGILKRPLPASALELKAWWANDRVGHNHSKLWLDAGWRVDSVNLQEKWVRFVRT
jgi:CBS domain-containing protein